MLRRIGKTLLLEKFKGRDHLEKVGIHGKIQGYGEV
jgi:hypothetical protein